MMGHGALIVARTHTRTHTHHSKRTPRGKFYHDELIVLLLCSLSVFLSLSATRQDDERQREKKNKKKTNRNVASAHSHLHVPFIRVNRKTE